MNFRTSARITFILSLIFSCSALAAPPSTNLTLSGKTNLILDATCTTCQGGTLDLYLRNNTTVTVPMTLHVGDLLNKTTGEPLAAGVTLEYFDSKLAPKPSSGDLAKNEILVLRVTVSSVLDEGEWEAKLFNGDVEIGTFSVVRTHLPFNVSLDVPKSDTPEITIEMCKPFLLPLKNDDPRTYPLSVDLIVKNRPAAVSVTLPPKGIANGKIPGDTLRSWFDNPWEGYFRDETVDGRLVMTLLKSPCPSGQCPGPATPLSSPSKVINLKVHLSYRSQRAQFFAIALLLFIGAICSLLLNSYLPNQLRRIQLKKDLDALAARVRDLPMVIASRLRVSLGLDARRCLALLTSQVGFQPGFAAVLTDVKQRMDSLEKRLALTEQLGSLRMRFETQRSARLFPTPMNKVGADFEAAVDHLRAVELSDQDLQSAQTIVKSLSDQIDDLDDIKKFCAHQSELVAQINKRAARLIPPLELLPPNDPNYPVKWPAPPANSGLDPLGLAVRMYNQLLVLKKRKDAEAVSPQPPGALPAAQPAATQPPAQAGPAEFFLQEDLADVDRLSLKFEMLRDCARLDLSDPHAKERIAHLAELLESQNSETFDAARRWCQQIKEHIFVDDAVAEVVSHANAEDDVKLRDWGAHPFKTRLLLSLLSLLPILFFICRLNVLGAISLGLVVLAFVFETRLLSAISAWLDRQYPVKSGQIFVADEDRVRVRIDTSQVYTYEPIQLRVCFCREDLNAAKAIDDITPMWDFGHDDLTPEDGWQVVHYFPRHRSYIMKVKFQRRTKGIENGQFVSGGFLRTTDLSPQNQGTAPVEGPIVFTKHIVHASSMHGGSWWSFFLEAVRLSVALVPALLALYAGALDKLAKLDLVSALIAVFLLGFSSDQVKNLLTQKST
jgi:hypothetical protein